MGKREKRAEDRHEVRTAVTIQVVRNGEALSGTTCDVSSHGFLLTLDQHADLKVGEEVVCEVSIPSDSGTAEALWGRGRLVRVDNLQVAVLLTKGSLKSTLCQPCPCCGGSGVVTSVATLCYDILSKAREIAPTLNSANVTLQVHPDIANELKTRKSALVEEFEHATQKSVIMETDVNLHWGQYKIR